MKYKIINECGITKFFIDDKEIPLIKSIKFERNSPDEVATLEVKMFPEECIIETDEGTKTEILKNTLDIEAIPKFKEIGEGHEEKNV